VSTPARLSTEEVRDLVGQGRAYLDVRTEEEFAAGHVPGAYNVPIRVRGAASLVDNPDFLPVVSATFTTDTPLVVGCQSGVRSLKAIAALLGGGYTALLEHRTGFGGSRDAFGRQETGWGKAGLPVETAAAPGHTYDELRKRRG
jgi:rhodanese-related sulfurtransferase